MNMVQDFLCLNYLRIAAVVSLYWVVSIVTVFVNKTLLSGKDIDFDAPLFIVWYQCIVSVVICLFIRVLGYYFPKTFSFPNSNPFSYDVIKKVLPLSILFTCMIGFNNLCLKYVGVSFYYIGRSLTTVFNVIFSIIILQDKISCKTIICCIVIVMGFWLGVDQESLTGSLSTNGVIYGLLASASLALFSINTKAVLPKIGNHIWLLSYYNNIYSCFILLPIIVFNGEIPKLYDSSNFLNFYFWLLMTISGICGFSIGYVTALQIKVTSPLTHNISGTAKACAQTVIATFWYSETKTLLWWLSNFIILLGSAAYTNVKQREMRDRYLESRTLRL